MEDHNNVVIAPLHGEIVEVLNASNGANDFALVVEVFRGHRFLVIYEWEEGGNLSKSTSWGSCRVCTMRWIRYMG